MSAKKILLDRIAQDDLPKALKELMFLADKYKDDQVRNDATFQSGRLKALEKQKINGILSHEEEHLQSAKIREALLQIIQDLPDDWTLDGSDNIFASVGTSAQRNWKKYTVSFAAIVAVLAGIAELSGYSIRDFFKEKEPIEQAARPSPPTPSISTSGDNSPAIITDDGDVNINFGEATPKNDTIIPPKKIQKWKTQ